MGVLYDMAGVADGDPLTTGNCGADIVNPAGGTITAAASAAAHGPVGAKFVPDGASYTICRWPVDTPSTVMGFGGAFSVNANSTISIASIRYGAGQEFTLLWGDGTVNVYASGGVSTVVASGLTDEAIYWISLLIDTTAGTVDYNLWALDGTAIASGTATIPATSHDIATADLGRISGGTGTITWDTIRFEADRTAPYEPMIEQRSSGASMTDITSVATGAGTKTANGWRPASATAGASGQGVKGTSFGTSTLVTVIATGAGIPHHPHSGTGASTADVAAEASGTGSKTASGGAALTITTAITGAGAKANAAGSTATVTATASGSGFKTVAGAVAAAVTATAIGAGGQPGRDIDVWASPVFTGWAASLITGYPETVGPIYQGDGWRPGEVDRAAITAGTFTNNVTAGPVWTQE